MPLGVRVVVILLRACNLSSIAGGEGGLARDGVWGLGLRDRVYGLGFRLRAQGLGLSA